LEATTMSEIWYTWRSTFKGVEDCWKTAWYGGLVIALVLICRRILGCLVMMQGSRLLL
jgi:hypothetical protein